MPFKDPEAKKAYQKMYSLKNREKEYLRVKAWREANPEKLAEQYVRYAKKYPEKIVERTLRWKAKDPEHAAKLSKAGRDRNKSRIVANKAKYRATKQNRTPIWVDAIYIERIKTQYKLAEILSKLTGIKYHVDHIIPLNGKKVSGLHVPSNLQVIPASVNHLKNNKFEVENGYSVR